MCHAGRVNSASQLSGTGLENTDGSADLSDGESPGWYRRTVGMVSPSTAVMAIVVLAVVVSYFMRSAIDDAYISFRYAKNLVEGRGLVFNPGERVEGYTNFLWTLVAAIPIWLGVSVEQFLHVITAASAGVAVWATYRLGRLVFRRDDIAMVGAILVGTNATFLSFATSGLETMPQTALLALAVCTVASNPKTLPSVRAVVTFSALGAVALLIRLDSTVVVGPVVVLWLLQMRRAGADWQSVVRRLAPGAAMAMVLLVPWFVWKVSYYGEWVPNTFFAKSDSSALNPMGVIFLAMFVITFFLFVPVGVLASKFASLAKPPQRLLTSIVVLWCCYIVYAGGDWMDFRFMVAVMPYLYLLLAWSALSLRAQWFQIATLTCCLIGSGVHWFYPGAANVDGLSTVRLLTVQNPPNWVTEGKALGRYFPGGLDREHQVTISVVAAGAVPYFSDLPAIDMVGLTDASVAREGLTIPYSSGIGKPGHLRISTMDYLRSRGVNLVIGLPVTRPAGVAAGYRLDDEIKFMFHGYPVSREELGPVQVVEIPVDAGQALLAVYLTPHPEVDQHIREDGWRVVPILDR